MLSVMADGTISIHNVTGVDMTLKLMGQGSRSYAFVIDWHFCAWITAAWLLLAHHPFRRNLQVLSHNAP